MKRLIAVILTLFILLSGFSLAVYAEDGEEQTTNIPRAPGMCGESISWSFDRETGILDISGNGAMDDFPEGAPWLEYREEIQEVRIWGNIDYIGAYAFEDHDAITDVYFGTSLRELGKRSFYSCDGLTKLELPSTFRVFGEESLRNCTFLKQIHCQGGMPSFRLNCLWDTWADIYYPVNNPWPLEHIEQLENAFQGRIEFLAEDGFDPYVPEGTAPEVTTEPATEATTEATEPPTEIPATQTTEPTEPATAPTAPPTEPTPTETTVPPSTEPPVIWGTEPPSEPVQPESGGGSWIAIGLISGVLLGVLIGELAFKRHPGGRGKGRGKGRYSR